MGRSIEEISSLWYKGDTFNNRASDRVGVVDDMLTMNSGQYRYTWGFKESASTVGVRMNGWPMVLVDSDLYYRAYLSCLFYGICRGVGDAGIRVSFSALRQTGIDLKDFEPYSYVTNENVYCSQQGVMLVAGDRYFMTCSDTHWTGILEVPRARTWGDAYRKIKPRAVRKWESEMSKRLDTEVKAMRQGEWYAIPRPDLKVKRRDTVKQVMLDGGNHMATFYTKIGKRQYARGTIRHRPEERTRSSWYKKYCRPFMRLGNCWHEIVQADFMNSYRGIRE